MKTFESNYIQTETGGDMVLEKREDMKWDPHLSGFFPWGHSSVTTVQDRGGVVVGGVGAGGVGVEIGLKQKEANILDWRIKCQGFRATEIEQENHRKRATEREPRNLCTNSSQIFGWLTPKLHVYRARLQGIQRKARAEQKCQQLFNAREIRIWSLNSIKLDELGKHSGFPVKPRKSHFLRVSARTKGKTDIDLL